MKNIIILSLLLFFGCSNDNSNIDKSKIYISCWVYKSEFDFEESAIYDSYCSITNSLGLDFSTATVKINNIPLSVTDDIHTETFDEQIHFKKNYLGEFNEGDIIHLSITDNLLGTISVQTTIPGIAPDFITTPELPAEGTENSFDTYTLSMDSNNDDQKFYVVGFAAFNDNSGNSRLFRGDEFIKVSSHTFELLNLHGGNNDDGYIYEWIAFYLSYANEAPIEDYSSGSCLLVSGPETIKTNKQSFNNYY